MHDAPQPTKPTQITLEKILNALDMHRQNVIALERKIAQKEISGQNQYVDHLRLMVAWTHKQASDMQFHERALEQGKYSKTSQEVLVAAQKRKDTFLAAFPEQDASINKVYMSVRKSVALSSEMIGK
jgi:hypothetical protein